MQTKQFSLNLEDGRTISCCMSGNGNRLGYITGGPGSFYFKGLSLLQNVYTLFTCDTLWAYNKSDTSIEKKLSEVTKESIIYQEHLVIKALKERFSGKTIDGFGFSGPGAFLFELALAYPNDFDLLIGTGIGLTELDPTFTKTNEIFYRQASPRRCKAFEEYQSQYKQLQNSQKHDAVEMLRICNLFDLKSPEALEKPYKQFVSETLALAPKLVYQSFDTEKTKQTLLEHWKTNLFGEHIDKKMQTYFFEHIYPQLKPLPTLKELAQKNQKILLIYGDSDYITPLPADILESLQKFNSIDIKIFERCGHIPYVEEATKYQEVILNFINQTNAKIEKSITYLTI